MTNVKAAIECFARELDKIDISEELEALDANKREQRRTKDALERSRKEAEALGARIRNLSISGAAADLEAAASAYLDGADPETETEDALRAKVASINAARKGLNQRLQSLSESERQIRNQLHGRIAEATSPARDVLKDAYREHLQAIEQIQVVTKVLESADRLIDYFGKHVGEVLTSASRESFIVERTGATPAWIVEALEPHREKIEQAKGTIPAFINQPRAPRPEPEPRPETDYVPGRGGNIGLPAGGLAMTYLR